MLWTLFYFFLALFLLVIVHEFGHFFVARRCGVKVLRFSFGFGKVLYSRRDKYGTEYAFSILPLGGYVKMLDETEAEVPIAERHLAFNRQSLWVRTLIVLAGPLFNFLFALILFWLVLIIGVKSLAPIIDNVQQGSLAEQAGLTAHQEMLAINGRPVSSWRDVQYALMPLIGSKDHLQMTVQSLQDGQQRTVRIPLSSWSINAQQPDVLGSLGIVPFMPRIPPIVGTVVEDSPAAKAGLLPGDEVRSVGQKQIDDWLILVQFVKEHPDQRLVLSINRKGKRLQREVDVGHIDSQGQRQGFLGLSSRPLHLPPDWLRTQRQKPLPAIWTAGQQTWELTRATFVLIGRMITGQLSWHSISGPIGIAEGASDSARSGLVHYLSFIALLSISLGVLNLLPIPMLDGGYLLYYLLEAIRRRPIPDEWKAKGAYVGMMLLVVLTVVAITNDVGRIVNRS